MRGAMTWGAMLLGSGMILSLASCATVPAPSGGVPSPMPGREATPPPTSTSTSTRPSTLPGGSQPSSSTAAAAPTVVDSLPSREAVAVLQTIPEPLATGAAPAPRKAAADTSASGPSVAPDTAATRTLSGVDESAQVPTPAPTQPLGDRPGTLTRGPDSLAVRPGTAPATSSAPTSPPSTSPSGSSPTAPSTGAAPTAKVPPDSCWRVQVAAPAESDKAVALRDAAQSQLLVAVVIEVEKGLYKIRTRDCTGAAVADQLKRRALAAGFAGAFRFKGKPK